MSFLFNTLYEEVKDEQITVKDAFDLFNEHGFINHGELAEKAISKATGIAQCGKNNPGTDLVNGVQIKHALTNSSQSYLKGFISIKKPKETQETIYAVVTETCTKSEYYFIFPYYSYSWRDGNTMSIPFDDYGNPKRSNDLWSYQVKLETFIQEIRNHKA